MSKIYITSTTCSCHKFGLYIIVLDVVSGLLIYIEIENIRNIESRYR